jgi:hypothetical protein
MRITVPMYEKGRSFILASGLLKAYEGHRFVYIHLLCQGFENIGKAILLAHDYEKYAPMLAAEYGHNLVKVLRVIHEIRGSSFLSANASSELATLSNLYKSHQFRYGDDIDFAQPPLAINADHLHQELVQHLDALNREFELLERDA